MTTCVIEECVIFHLVNSSRFIKDIYFHPLVFKFSFPIFDSVNNTFTAQITFFSTNSE